MAYRKFLDCGHMTGIQTDACSVCKQISDYIDCNCESGGHPRKCQMHPDSYQKHIEALEGENSV